MWKNVPFSQKMFMNTVTLNNSLAESMKISGDHLYTSFLNEFDHQMDSDFEERLVNVNPRFSEENDFKKDVQLTFDENVINNQFQALFNSNRVFSLQETVIGWLPANLQTYAKVLSTFFSTVSFSRFFPSLQQEHGLNRRLDIRCGFSKQFLNGKLTEKHTSQIWFKEGNNVEFTFNFGCGIFTGPIGDNPLTFF